MRLSNENHPDRPIWARWVVADDDGVKWWHETLPQYAKKIGKHHSRGDSRPVSDKYQQDKI